MSTLYDVHRPTGHAVGRCVFRPDAATRMEA
jgi:hypothetical protein